MGVVNVSPPPCASRFFNTQTFFFYGALHFMQRWLCISALLVASHSRASRKNPNKVVGLVHSVNSDSRLSMQPSYTQLYLSPPPPLPSFSLLTGSFMAVPYVDAFMQAALAEATTALLCGEVPVGCVFVPIAANADIHRRLLSMTTASTSPSLASSAESSHTDAQKEELAQEVEAAVAARGRNHTNELHHALAHAEFIATQQLLDKAAAAAAATAARTDNADAPSTSSGALSTLSSYVLYVTVEPCVMCGAMLLYNYVGHVFFGCRNPRFGGNGTVLPLHRVPACKRRRSESDGEVKREDACVDALSASPSTSANSTSRDASGGDSLSAPASQQVWWSGYSSEGGHREEDAIALLQRFYERENPNAPGHKRRVKAAA